MTTRLKGCVVTFATDMREDDAEGILNAILQIRGVACVEGDVSTVSDHINRSRIRLELQQKLFAVLDSSK